MKTLRFCDLIIVTYAALIGCSTLKKPFYYQIESPQGTKGYLLGTIHRGVPMEDLPSGVARQFENSNPLYIELDRSSPSGTNFETAYLASFVIKDLPKSPFMRAAKLLVEKDRKNPNAKLDSRKQEMKAAYLEVITDLEALKAGSDLIHLQPAAFANGQGLEEQLSHEEWQDIVKTLQPFFETEANIKTLRIETIVYFLSGLRGPQILVSREKAIRFEPRWSMDLNLIKKAKEMKRDVHSMDTDFSFPPQCLAEAYLLTIRYILTKNGEQWLANIDQMEEVYREGDEDKLNHWVTASASPFFEQCVLVDRNRSWIPKIEAQMNESQHSAQPPFFAFGAAHLGGSHGLIKLLREKGFKVHRAEF